MATTTIQVNLDGTLSPTSAKLYVAESGIEVPDPMSRTLTAGGEWQFTCTTAEALVGIYRVNVLDGGGVQIGVFWVWIEADAVATYIADTQFGLAVLKRAASAIEAKTDLIGTGTAFSGPPVTESGQLARIVIGDDYNAANGRAFSWTFDAITGFTVGSCTAKFGLKHATNPTAYSALVTAATVTDLGSGRWSVSFDVDKTDTASLPQAHYEWSVEIIHSGEEVTVAKSEETRDRVKLVTKQT